MKVKTPEEALATIRARLEVVGDRSAATPVILQALYSSMFEVEGILRLLVRENDELRRELAAVRDGYER